MLQTEVQAEQDYFYPEKECVRVHIDTPTYLVFEHEISYKRLWTLQPISLRINVSRLVSIHQVQVIKVHKD